MNTNHEQELITLRREHVEATIAPQRGAIVTSFRVRDREMLYLDQATFNDRSKNVRGGIPLLFPSAGKLENDRWSYGGRSGELKQHGFARNLAWRVESNDGSAATVSIRSNETTLAGYPWQFSAKVTYALESNALAIKFDVTNEDTTAMPFTFGLHPYFLVSDKARARIPTRARRAYDNVAKRAVPFAGFDFTQGEVDIHLLDHGGASARLELDGASIAIDCSPEFTRWVVWTLPGKDFICLEPWSSPGNALNSAEDLIVVAPGAMYRCVVRLSI